MLSKLENVCNNPSSPGFIESLILAGISGSIASTLTNPLDVAKVRIQVQRAERSFAISSGGNAYESSMKIGYFGYKNLVHGLYLLGKHEGFGAFFKGKYFLIFFLGNIYSIYKK